MDGQTHWSPPETLIAVLRCLGAELERSEDLRSALRARRLHLQRQPIAPVTVAWEGRPASVRMRLPRPVTTLRLQLQQEDGVVREWDAAGEAVRESRSDGQTYHVITAPLPGDLPWGYHKLTIDSPSGLLNSQVIAAPVAALPPEEGPDASLTRPHTWGVFLPLYALRTAEDWGAGDFTGLGRLGGWAASLGAGVIATLPLLAGFLDDPFEPSPYAPVSRLAWNEFYVDVTQAPEYQQSPIGALETMRMGPHVDYSAVMAEKRRVLEAMAARLTPAREEDLHRFLARHPSVSDYARFRAVTETRRETWHLWPERLREGQLREGDYQDAAARYHEYVQWLAREQLASKVAAIQERNAVLYLDLPLGVNGAGYDVWRYRSSFAQGMSGGAPPDTIFTGGQDWGFPPLHPERIRENGHDYLIACLRTHLQMSRMLRIDHVMGLHRLYWVPHGASAKDGVYVRYPAEELYAVLCLEARRHRATIVGENLGTVPPYVNQAMDRHGIRKMYVLQYEADPNGRLREPQPSEVASLNTHDMPTFAGYWWGNDIEDQFDLGLIGEPGLSEGQRGRAAVRQALVRGLQAAQLLSPEASADSEPLESVLSAACRLLAASPSPLVLVNLEDLWLEPAPQNTPGTSTERANWVRKARYTLDEIQGLSGVREVLSALTAGRAGSGS